MAHDRQQRACNNKFVQCIIANDLKTLEAMPKSETMRCSKSTVYYVYPRQRPLHVAAFLGNYAVVSLLLNAGVEVNVQCPGGRTPLFLALTQGHLDIVSLFLNAGGDLLLLPVSSKQTALHWAAACGQYLVARFFIESVNVDVSIRNYRDVDENVATGETALDLIARDTPLNSPLVMVLFRALTQCGGPVPRGPCRALRNDIGIELEECLTDDDREFTVGVGITRVRHWREAAARQRRLHVRQYLPTRDDYDPSRRWAPAVVQVEAGEAGVSARRRQKQFERPLECKRRRQLI